MRTKTAIITGASRGIGAAAADILAECFDCLVLISRNSDGRLTQTAKSIQQKGMCECIAFAGDASDYDFVSETIQALETDGHAIDTVINNAGISIVGLLQDMTPDNFQQILNVNISSVFNTCHAVIPYMINRQAGRILNISSVWGLVGASCEVAYSATKGAVNGFTKALAKELAPSHIAVNAVAFGAIDTEMNNHLSPEEKKMLCEEIPAGKMAAPEEAAMCIRHILEMPDYLTGEVIKFDGGWI